MKLNILNDIHLEFDQGPNFALPGGDVLLLAGDVACAAYLRPNRTDKLARKHSKVAKAFFHDQCAKYNKVFYIMGNHEHYSHIFDYTAEVLREFLMGTNVTLLDNEFADLNDEWQIFGATLWTDYNNQDWFAMHAAKDKMNDHHIIKKIKPVAGPYGDFLGRFLPVDAYAEHNRTVGIIDTELYDMDRIDRPTIVMTHHAPTFQSIHPRFNGDILNYAYATDLSELILRHQNIKYWLHGHMHDNWDYMVGECRVLCNPRGYQGYALNEDFNQNFELEI